LLGMTNLGDGMPIRVNAPAILVTILYRQRQLSDR
jgi:hypothetical protein